MDIDKFQPVSDGQWEIRPHSGMNVPAVIIASRKLLLDMDQKVYDQITNVARLPGIVRAAYAMPDAHWGYGFPIGGVAAFDADAGGVISAGGVGFDISCGVRSLHTGLGFDEIMANQQLLADILYEYIPAGLGSSGHISLDNKQMNDMLYGGAVWAVEQGYGEEHDLDRIEERGRMYGAEPEQVSDFAKMRQHREMGTLGSGNHYLEVQNVTEIHDNEIATAFGIHKNDILISIHCGSRGLGHQIGTEFLKEMSLSAKDFGIKLPDRDLACAPIHSELGRRYLGAMRAGINCAFANRQIITHLVREAIHGSFPHANIKLLYDVSHNTCKVESHVIDGENRTLYVHRKGATRAYGPGNTELPVELRSAGQPVLIGGTMGTSSYILAGAENSSELAFSSACHGAGRNMSRRQALRQWQGSTVIRDLADRGIIIHSPSKRGVAEEAPGAYKDVNEVVNSAVAAGLARSVARLEPLICIKG